MAITYFNVRVYGLCIHNDSLLISEELIRGKLFTKLPGGGLEFGEGTIDCLIREFREELNLDVEVLEHFYTTDFFVPSAFDPAQIMSIYYLVAARNLEEIVNNNPAEERFYWKPLAEVDADLFSLPIDKKVGEMVAVLHRNGAWKM